MPYDYSKLIGKIAEKGKKQKDVAKEGAHITPQAFSKKITNKSMFNQEQMRGVCVYLEIPLIELPDYFFCWKS